MEKEDFGRHVAQLVAADKWNEIVSLMHGIGLPPDWKEMVKPLFEGFLGQKVEASIIPASEIPEHQLVWLKKAPRDIQDRLESAVKLSYEIVRSEDDKESGEFVLPIILIDQKWKILLVGPDA